MSLETIEGIEEIQEDVADKGDALDKKLKIHLPIKQPSYSSVSSRRSSINVVADYPETAIDDPQFQKKNVKNLGKFSTIKEKIKKDGKKKKKKVKALQQKVTANKKLKDISDNDANNDKYDEDYESEPDVSEIVLTKPKVYSKIEKDRNEDFDGPKSEIKAAKEIKKSSKRGQKKSKKRVKRKMFSSDPAAAELERLLAEKDKLLRDELAKLDPTKAPSKPDSSFYPPPKNLEKRRCYFHKGAKALKCTVCSGGKFINLINHLLLINFIYIFSALPDQENI